MKLMISGMLRHAPPELQERWLGQFIPWTKFFKKIGNSVVQGGTKRRRKILLAARQEIARTLAAFEQRADELWPPLACRKGCAHCCRVNVEVNIVEAARLAEIVRHMPAERRADVIRRLKSADADWQQADRQESRYRHPCPFLEGSECSIYEDRPLACRSYVSVDVAFCIAALNATTAAPQIAFSPNGHDVPSANVRWHIMLASIGSAANTLIGLAGSLPAAVLERLGSQELKLGVRGPADD
jgi:hypothetical protein